jgi:hypothetical protein
MIGGTPSLNNTFFVRLSMLLHFFTFYTETFLLYCQ